MSEPTADTITQFIARWEKSGGSEKANYALFFTELCDEILLVPHPEPAGPDNEKNLYSFERVVTHKVEDGTTATGFIDLYKAGCFVLESKQGTFAKAADSGTLLNFIPSNTTEKSGHGKRGTLAFDKILQRAYNQARKYITAVPPAEGRPPFLIVCDVGHTIDLYAEFTGTGGHYERFPDPNSPAFSYPISTARRFANACAKSGRSPMPWIQRNTPPLSRGKWPRPWRSWRSPLKATARTRSSPQASSSVASSPCLPKTWACSRKNLSSSSWRK